MNLHHIIDRSVAAVSTPVPGCVCPEGYVRDVCHGHPEPDCPFKGLFGLDLQRAHFGATYPDGVQLQIGAVHA